MEIHEILTLLPTHSQTLITPFACVSVHHGRSTTDMAVHKYFKSNGNSLGLCNDKLSLKRIRRLKEMKTIRACMRIRASAITEIKTHEFRLPKQNSVKREILNPQPYSTWLFSKNTIIQLFDTQTDKQTIVEMCVSFKHLSATSLKTCTSNDVHRYTGYALYFWEFPSHHIIVVITEALTFTKI